MLIAQSSLSIVHLLLMCARKTAKNDDGVLRDVLRTAERVSNDLSSLGGGAGVSRGGRGRPSREGGMDLSRCTSDELRAAVAPMVRELEKLDAAALLSLTPVADDAEGEGAVLDPARGLTVSPIHDLVSPPHRDDGETSVVRYLHVREVPHRYSAGIFVFSPNARMPLHDHPNMVVLTRVLYGELEVLSYDVVAPRTDDDDEDHDDDDRMDLDRDPNGDDDKMSDDARPRQSALRASFNWIKEFVWNRAFSFQYDGVDGTRRSLDPVLLRVRPNLNPMGGRRRRGQGDDCDHDHRSSAFVITAPNVTCLYPHEGNCHAFVAGPRGAAVLDVLFPPYDDEEDRECTYYERATADDDDDDGGDDVDGNPDGERRRPLVALAPIDQPDDFNCLGGSYGRFGSD